jgi:hypothetical protein
MNRRNKTVSGLCKRFIIERNIKVQVIKLFFLLIIVPLFSCVKETDYPEDIETMPSAYDLRVHGWITPVRNQNGVKPDGTSDIGSTVGLCWAFSSLASLESSMLKQDITNNPQSPEASLSPWYLGNYIEFNNPCYEYNPNTIPELLPSTAFGYYNSSCGWGGGGISSASGHWTAEYLISGKEIPTWDDCPMPADDMTSHLTLSPPVSQLKEKYNIERMLLYFADDFLSIDDYRMEIKNYILEFGAIQSFVHLEAIDFPGMISQLCNGIEYIDYRFMDKVNFNMFTYKTDDLCTGLFTHAIAIIGWDDNRNINIEGHTTKGAWLIKDSSGDMSWDDGFFWVAYDDPVISAFAVGLVACNESNYEHQSKYQTSPGILSTLSPETQCNDDNCIDFGMYSYLLNGNSTGTAWGVAKFSLTNNEVLVAFGLFCSNRNQKVRVHIYRDNLNSTPLHTQDFTLDELGYHLLKLNHEIEFSSNETMIIAVGFENESFHTRLPLCYVQNENHSFVNPTFFGTMEDGVFQLQPYSDFKPNSAFYIQAIVAN